VKIHSTASSVKNVKVVFQHGANVNLQRLTALLVPLDHPDLQEIQDNLVPLDLVVMMAKLELLLPHAPLKILHASNVPLVLLAHPVPMGHLVPLALMDNPVLLANLLDKDPLDLPDLLEMLDQTEIPVPLDNLAMPVQMVNVVLVPLDPKVLPETLVPPVLLDQMAIPVLPETMVLLDLLALLEIPVLLVEMVNLVLLAALVFLAQMLPIVPAPLVQLSSSAVVLKLAKSAHHDHVNSFFNETIKVVRALFALFLYSNKIKIKGF